MNNSGPLDSRQLQIFMSVAARGSVKAAAAELFLTSSAVSHSVAKLEEVLGVQLFHRSPRGLLLTAPGDLLRRKALPLVAQMRQLETLVKGDTAVGGDELRVTVGASFLRYVVPDVLREFNRRFPRGGGLRLDVTERDEALQALAHGKLDGAIIVNPPEEDAELTHTRLFEDELHLLIDHHHPLAALDEIPLRSLAQRVLLVPRLQSYTVRSVLARLRRLGVEPRDCVEVGTIGNVLQMVRLRQGVALIPRWIFEHEPHADHLRLRPVQSLNFVRTWAYVRPRWLAPEARGQTLVDLCQQWPEGAAANGAHPPPERAVAYG